MALDPETSEFLAKVAAAGRPALHTCTVAEARALNRASTKLFGTGPAMYHVQDHQLGSPGSQFRVRQLAPSANPAGVIVYYHGGGWVLGDVDGFDTMGRQLAARTGCTVLLVEYRLAPEHPFPAPVQDAYLALDWAAATLLPTTTPLIVAGDSAGGNLAAVVTRWARDRKGPAIALQVLIYPVTDAHLDSASYQANDNQQLLTRDGMAWFWEHYVPNPADRGNPDASPLQAQDLRHLPPTLLVLAEHDVLRDEGQAYGAALAKAGVAVESRCFAGQMHGFFTMVNVLPGAAQGMDYVVTRIATVLATHG